VLSARDNTWDNAYLTDPSHSFPRQHGPTQAELDKAAGVLLDNYIAFLGYLNTPDVAHRLKRLLFRMLGIYHGGILDQPAPLYFSCSWLPDTTYLKPSELALGYETTELTFMDVGCQEQ
jgi:hypothetical protein